MSQISVRWNLIPDGSTSIVRVTIEGEFAVDSANATTEAEVGIAALIARISTEDEGAIREKLVADRWLGDWQRPEEPSGKTNPIVDESLAVLLRGEREESVPRRALQGNGSSLSHRDPMPELFVVGLALLSLMAIFGFLSIAQFLQQVWGGK